MSVSTILSGTPAGVSVNVTAEVVTSTVLLADVATVGTNAGSTTPLLVVGPGAPAPAGSVVFDKVLNPAVVQWYAPSTIVTPFTTPSESDAPVTILSIAVPASAQSAKFYQVNFTYRGNQTLGSANAQNYRLYLAPTSGGAFSPANANGLLINIDAATASPVTWASGSVVSANAGTATIDGAALPAWYSPTVPGGVTNLYLVIDGISATTVGGQLSAGFTSDAICLAYN